MTSLDGLAGGRNPGVTVSAGVATAASKDDGGSGARQRAGGSGAFGAILSELARPDVQSSDTEGMGEGGGSRDRGSIPARGDYRLDRSASNAASSPESSLTALVDRVSATGTPTRDGDPASPREDSNIEARPVHDAEAGLRGEARGSNNAAPGKLQASGRRARSDAEAISDVVASGTAASDSDKGASPSSAQTNQDPTVSAVPFSPAASMGLQSFAIAMEGPPEPPVEFDRSRRTSSSVRESAVGAPVSSDPVSRPQGFRQLGHGRAEDGTADGGITWTRPLIEVARKPDFAEPIVDLREGGPPLQASAREKVTVLAAETHFPPVGMFSPIDQIVHNVAAELAAVIAPAAQKRLPESAKDIAEPREASATCIRNLTVLLEPANLGTVTIKLRLTGTSLGIEIEADELETTRLIGRGRHTLTEKLRALGLTVDTLMVAEAGRSCRTS